jgi:hypothetical protein
MSSEKQNFRKVHSNAEDVSKPSKIQKYVVGRVFVDVSSDCTGNGCE